MDTRNEYFEKRTINALIFNRNDLNWCWYITTLGASVADDTTDIELTDKRQVKIHPFANLKELHADTQANAFAAHLILPNHTNASWTNSNIIRRLKS